MASWCLTRSEMECSGQWTLSKVSNVSNFFFFFFFWGGGVGLDHLAPNRFFFSFLFFSFL